MKIYDFVVVGAGISGIMVAKTIAKKGFSVLIVERGQNIDERKSFINGWFGKFPYLVSRLDVGNFDPKSFGILETLKEINGGKLEHFYSGEVSLENFSSFKKNHYQIDSKCGRELAKKTYQEMLDLKNVDIIFGNEINKINFDEKGFLIHTSKKLIFCGKKCILSIGERCPNWILDLYKAVNIKISKSHARLGVRVETPSKLLKKFLQLFGDLQLESDNILINDVRINSLIGEKDEEELISSFSYSVPYKKSEKTNFFISLEDTCEEVTRITKIINILSNDKIRRERLDDFLNGNSVLTSLNQFDAIRKSLQILSLSIPSFVDYSTVYIPEIKTKGSISVDKDMKTEIEGLYSVGECTKSVNGLLDAFISGYIAGNNIIGG